MFCLVILFYQTKLYGSQTLNDVTFSAEGLSWKMNKLFTELLKLKQAEHKLKIMKKKITFWKLKSAKLGKS